MSQNEHEKEINSLLDSIRVHSSVLTHYSHFVVNNFAFGFIEQLIIFDLLKYHVFSVDHPRPVKVLVPQPYPGTLLTFIWTNLKPKLKQIIIPVIKEVHVPVKVGVPHPYTVEKKVSFNWTFYASESDWIWIQVNYMEFC